MKRNAAMYFTQLYFNQFDLKNYKILVISVKFLLIIIPGFFIPKQPIPRSPG